MNRSVAPTRHAFLTALLGVVIFFASPAVAADRIGDAVMIKSFTAPVEVRRAETPGKWLSAKVGLSLKKGDVVRTGKGAKAVLLMKDGSKMSLSGMSRLQVQEVAPNRLFGLDTGRVKSSIKKLRGNTKFEIKTPLAAASVRGTVFEVGYDEDVKQGYLDVEEGAVALSKDGQEILVHPGERVGFVPDRPLEAPGRRGAAAPADGDREDLRREVALGMSKEAVMAAAAEEMRLAEYQEGKTLIDVFGQRVRLEEYIIRRPKEVAAADQDKAFKLVVLNERDNRFDYFYYRGVFNTALPDDLSLALGDLGGKLGTTAPTYYLSSYEMGMSNTQDTLKDVASGGHQVKITYDGTDYTLTDPNNATNTRTVVGDVTSVLDGVTYHKLYDPVNDRYQTVSDAQFTAGDYRPIVFDDATDTFRVYGSGDTFWRTGYNSYSHALNGATKQSYAVKSTLPNTLAIDTDADFTFAGGTLVAFVDAPSGADVLHNRIRLYYGDGTTETVNTYLIDDEGKMAPAAAFAGITSGQAYKNELLKWNYEETVECTEFGGRKIDIVVEPKILIKSGLIK
jgi:hypothetical protein